MISLGWEGGLAPRRSPLTAYCSLLLLFLPEHHVLEKRMMCGKTRDTQSGKAIAKSALENEAANKSGWRCRGDLEARMSVALSNICCAASGA